MIMPNTLLSLVIHFPACFKYMYIYMQATVELVEPDELEGGGDVSCVKFEDSEHWSKPGLAVEP